MPTEHTDSVRLLEVITRATRNKEISLFRTNPSIIKVGGTTIIASSRPNTITKEIPFYKHYKVK